MRVEIPEPSVDVNFYRFPYLSDKIKELYLLGLDKEAEQLKEWYRADLARAGDQPQQFVGTGVGDTINSQCCDVCSRVDNRLRTNAVLPRQEVWNLQSAQPYISPDYNRYYNQLVASFNRTDSLSRYITVPFSGGYGYGDVVRHSDFICPRCGQDVRRILWCTPLEIESGPKRYDFDPDSVVEANPNRQELSGS